MIGGASVWWAESVCDWRGLCVLGGVSACE